MSCEHLVCASCAGPVVEGRCSVCRSARAEVHHHGLAALSPQAIAVLLALVALLLVVASRLGG